MGISEEHISNPTRLLRVLAAASGAESRIREFLGDSSPILDMTLPLRLANGTTQYVKDFGSHNRNVWLRSTFETYVKMPERYRAYFESLRMILNNNQDDQTPAFTFVGGNSPTASQPWASTLNYRALPELAEAFDSLIPTGGFESGIYFNTDFRINLIRFAQPAPIEFMVGNSGLGDISNYLLCSNQKTTIHSYEDGGYTTNISRKNGEDNLIDSVGLEFPDVLSQDYVYNSTNKQVYRFKVARYQEFLSPPYANGDYVAVVGVDSSVDTFTASGTNNHNIISSLSSFYPAAAFPNINMVVIKGICASPTKLFFVVAFENDTYLSPRIEPERVINSVAFDLFSANLDGSNLQQVQRFSFGNVPLRLDFLPRSVLRYNKYNQKLYFFTRVTDGLVPLGSEPSLKVYSFNQDGGNATLVKAYYRSGAPPGDINVNYLDFDFADGKIYILSDVKIYRENLDGSGRTFYLSDSDLTHVEMFRVLHG